MISFSPVRMGEEGLRRMDIGYREENDIIANAWEPGGKKGVCSYTIPHIDVEPLRESLAIRINY